MQQHNVLAFLKKYLIKTFHTWTHEIAFVYLSICPSLFSMGDSIVANLTLYNRGELLLSLLWYSPPKDSLKQLYISLYIFTYIYIYIYIYMYIYTYIYIYNIYNIYLYLSIYLSICIYLSIYLSITQYYTP